MANAAQRATFSAIQGATQGTSAVMNELPLVQMHLDGLLAVRVQRARINAERRVAVLVDASIAAAEQVQDKRLEFLEQGEETNPVEFVLLILLGLFIDSKLAGSAIRVLTKGFVSRASPLTTKVILAPRPSEGQSGKIAADIASSISPRNLPDMPDDAVLRRYISRKVEQQLSAISRAAPPEVTKQSAETVLNGLLSPEIAVDMASKAGRDIAKSYGFTGKIDGVEAGNAPGDTAGVQLRRKMGLLGRAFNARAATLEANLRLLATAGPGALERSSADELRRAAEEFIAAESQKDIEGDPEQLFDRAMIDAEKSLWLMIYRHALFETITEWQVDPLGNPIAKVPRGEKFRDSRIATYLWGRLRDDNGRPFNTTEDLLKHLKAMLQQIVQEELDLIFDVPEFKKLAKELNPPRSTNPAPLK
jgi:hypothetical protein